MAPRAARSRRIPQRERAAAAAAGAPRVAIQSGLPTVGALVPVPNAAASPALPAPAFVFGAGGRPLLDPRSPVRVGSRTTTLAQLQQEARSAPTVGAVGKGRPNVPPVPITLADGSSRIALSGELLTGSGRPTGPTFLGRQLSPEDFFGGNSTGESALKGAIQGVQGGKPETKEGGAAQGAVIGSSAGPIGAILGAALGAIAGALRGGGTVRRFPVEVILARQKADAGLPLNFREATLLFNVQQSGLRLNPSTLQFEADPAASKPARLPTLPTLGRSRGRDLPFLPASFGPAGPSREGPVRGVLPKGPGERQRLVAQQGVDAEAERDRQRILQEFARNERRRRV